MNDDMSQFLGVFLDDSAEQIAQLEKHFLVLEHDSSPELLQEIFRAAHTLKGSSRAMSFTSMGELTHAMEDVFDSLRKGERTVDRALADALFAGLDALKAMLDEIAAQGVTTQDTTLQTARLRALLTASADNAVPAARLDTLAGAEEAGQSTPNSATATIAGEMASAPWTTRLSESERMAFQDAMEAGCLLYGMRVHIAPDCVMKSVRALMVLQALEHVGALLAATPNEEAIENEAFADSIEIVIATETDVATLRQTVEKINEIGRVEVVGWTLDGTADTKLLKESVRMGAESGNTEEGKKGGGNSASGDNAQAEDAARAGGKPDSSKPAPPAPAQVAQAQTVRVDVARLDSLLNLVGELVIDRTRLARVSAQVERRYEFSPLTESLNDTAAHIGRITDELQNEIMKARMLPIDNVFSRFPRMIRDLAQKLSKEVEFVVEGRETELDRSVIEVIGDPLIHMLRNSVDHGIEMPDDRLRGGKPRAGTVWLRARHQENHIVIEIQDDGKGLDPAKLRAKAVENGLLTPEAAAHLTDREAIQLIFASGFSTAQVVSEVSGRGVGMDIVRSNLQRLGATVAIDSAVGVGSTFTIRLPLTLAIIRGLLVDVQGCVYALPLGSVLETLRVRPDALHTIGPRAALLHRERALPLVFLRDVFAPDCALTPKGQTREPARRQAKVAAPLSAPASIDTNNSADSNDFASDAEAETAPSALLPVVVVGSGGKQVGLVVDALIGEQEVVIKTLGRFLGDIPGISGATILGDGRVALIVDTPGLIGIAAEARDDAWVTERTRERERVHVC